MVTYTASMPLTRCGIKPQTHTSAQSEAQPRSAPHCGGRSSCTHGAWGKGGRVGVRGGREQLRGQQQTAQGHKGQDPIRAQPTDPPEGDVVVLVGEGDDPAAVIFGHREQVAEYIRDLGQKEEKWQMPSLALQAPSPHPTASDSPAYPGGRRSHA